MICPLCHQQIDDQKVAIVYQQVSDGSAQPVVICPTCADVLPVPEIPEELRISDMEGKCTR